LFPTAWQLFCGFFPPFHSPKTSGDKEGNAPKQRASNFILAFPRVSPLTPLVFKPLRRSSVLFGISQRVFTTLLALLKESPRASRGISSLSQHTFGDFLFISFERTNLHLFLLKIEDATEKLKNWSEVLLLFMFYPTISL
jgi:hypothetical protein